MTSERAMLRWIWISLLAGCGAAVAEPSDPPHPCDPATETREVEVPPEPPPVCGDGRATRSRTTCTQTCSFGCGTEGCADVECRYAEERCDGDDFGAWTCADNGYAGGTLRCSAECELDWSECRACVEGPGLGCATAAFDGGSSVILLALGERVAVVSRDEETGDLVGGFVSADLELTRFRPLATGTAAAAAWGERIAFVSRQRQLRVIDVRTRRARTLAEGIHEGRTYVLPETGGSGIAVVTGWDRHDATRVQLFESDGTPMAPSRAAHFADGAVRVVVAPVRAAAPESRVPDGLLPGDQVVGFGSGGHPLVLVRRGDDFHYIAPVASYSWGGGSIQIGWRDYRFADAYELAGEPRVEHIQPEPQRAEAPGLGAVAVAGASTIEAFGGLLVVNAMDRPGSLGLYLVRPQ